MPVKHPGQPAELIQAIDQWLPQTQCRQCGYPRCLAYARAIAEGSADINQCPPGGNASIHGIAALLGQRPKALNTDYGETRSRTVVRIDEARCIGCTLCIEVCPVDAIVGAAKHMHTVIEAECTGCELCLPACPVDCIDILPAAQPAASGDSLWPGYSLEQTERARRRTEMRLDRLDRRQRQHRLDAMHKKARSGGHRRRIRNQIADAVSRVRARRRFGHHTNQER